jgi:hypothetical protein|tara:strand:+ start:2719 stop:3390 length:672 start_codon:yes stop_codon:yes gene_type:complete
MTTMNANLKNFTGIITLLACAGCSNPFAPSTSRPPAETPLPPAVDATTAAVVMANLERAFNEGDEVLYESIIDDRFWFTETDCQGDLILANGKEDELDLMFGARDGSSPGVFDIYRQIEWSFTQSRRDTEQGRDFPKAFEDDPDGHPDEDWEVFRGRVEILLLEAEDEGFRVDQVMNFKMRQGEDGLWRVVRWIDDPLAGDCGDGALGKPASRLTWSAVKRLP